MLDFLARQRWWFTRLLMLPLHLLVFTIITFLLLRMVPGDPVIGVLGANYTDEAYLAMQKSLGLDGTVWQQLGNYIANLLQLNLGQSISTGEPVIVSLMDRLPGTLELAVQGLVLTIIVSVLLSHLAVFHPRNIVSKAIIVYSRAAGALPEFVLAIVALFVFYAVLHWAPAPLGRLDTGLPQETLITGFPFLDTIIQGYWVGTISMAQHLVLPLIVMVIAQSAVVVKLLVSGLQGAIDDPATAFRITTGSGRMATTLSIYRRAAPSVVTLVGQMFGYLVGGTIVIETLFGFAGVGSLAVKAVLTTDYPAIQGFLLVIAAITLIVYMLVDLAVMIIDPRRRPGAVGSN